MWNAEQKLKRLQIMVNQGIFIEDPGGLLWMSDKMKKIIEEFNEDQKLHVLIRKKAKDNDDFKSGCWSYLYMVYARDCSSVELNEAVAVFQSWEKAVAEDRLREWSMGLRLR